MPIGIPLVDRTIIENEITAWDYFIRLCEMSLACFKWENLPETCDPRMMEISLLTIGRVLFFKDEELGYLTLPFNYGGNFNCYGLPTERIAYSNYNSYTAHRTINDSVIIFNNKLRNAITVNIVMYARRLYEIDRTIDVNVNAQKTPILLIGDQKQQLALRNLYRKYKGNEPVIYGDKQVSQTDIKALTTMAPYVSDQLYRLKTNLWNEVLTYLGVANITTDKKERMITDEVDRGMGGVMVNRNIRLKERQDACKKINDMFGLNVKVSFDENGFERTSDYSDETEDKTEQTEDGENNE